MAGHPVVHMIHKGSGRPWCPQLDTFPAACWCIVTDGCLFQDIFDSDSRNFLVLVLIILIGENNLAV